MSNRANQGAGTTGAADNSVAAGSSWGNGEIRVGLQGGFGRVDVGAVNYNSLSTYLTGQPFGTAIGSGFRTFYINDAQATSQVRSDNAIRYVTPAFNGFTASLYKANKQVKASPSSATGTNAATNATSFSTSLGAYDMQGTQEIGLNYAKGPINASFSQLKQDFKDVGAAGGVENTVNTLGANYTMGAARLFALHQTNKTNTNSVDNSAFSLSATYTMGAVVLMVQSGELKSDAGATKGKKSTLLGLGADYNLSKRTAVYFRAESIDDKAFAMNAAVNPGSTAGGTAVTAAGTDQKFARTAIGIRHAF